MRSHLVLCLAILSPALALAGCGEERSKSSDVVSYLGNECAIEMQFERTATERQVEAFVRRVRSTRHVAYVEVLSRQRNIALFMAELRRSSYIGDEFSQLEARFRRGAGRVLIATPDDNKNVPAIIGALQTLPGAVASVVDRPSCDT